MSDRYLTREMADVMCNQASLDSMREQHYKDSVEIDRLNAELVRVKEQRNALRVRLQCLAGDLERATLSAIRTVSRKWEVSDE